MQSEVRRYRVIEAVGRGGFGTVYRAEFIGEGGFRKPVALKVLNPDIAEHEDFAERLRDEARMLGLLRHRAVVRVDGLLRLNGRWTVVMEYVQGVDLKVLLSRGAVQVAPALEMVQEVASALGSAFEERGPDGLPLRLLHRDIKPSNIQLTAAGEVKILDFGVARAEFKQRESVTRSIFFGSLGYMAPERLDGIDTHAGDVYALGAVLYELLMGTPLGRTSANQQRHQAHINQAMALLSQQFNDPDLARLLTDCLAYDDAARPWARDLERRIRPLRMRYIEPYLRDFAEGIVPPLLAQRGRIDDDLSGSILVEQAEVSGTFPPEASVAILPPTLDEERPPRGSLWLGMISGVASAAVVITAGVLASTALWVALQPEPVAQRPAVHDDAAILALADDPQAAQTMVEDVDDGDVSVASTDAPTDAPKGVGSKPDASSKSAASSDSAASASSHASSSPDVATRRPPVGRRAHRSVHTDESGGVWGSTATVTTEPMDPESSTSTSSSTGSAPTEAAPTEAATTEAATTAPAPVLDARTGGTVLFTGDAKRVRLVRLGKSYATGLVPVGIYDILASFDGVQDVAAGTVTVQAGHRVTLKCRDGLKRCTPQY